MRRDFVAAAVGAGLFFLLAFVPALFGFDVFGIGRVLTGAAATAQQKLAADQQETLARLDELAAQVAGLESAVKDKAEDAPEKPDVTAEMSDQGGKGNGPPFSEVPIQRTELGKPSPLAEAEVESPATAELASVPDPIEAKATEESAPAQPASPVKADRISFTLEPGKSAYVRLKMQEGESAKYAWTVRGGLVNYDMQGKGQGGSKTYKSRREASSDNGTLIAGFSGEHGWLWRNAGSAPVILTMATRGQYAEIKGVP